MSRFSPLPCLGVGAILALSLAAAQAQEPKFEKGLWSWGEKGFELYSPAFSAKGDELALVRKRHYPDGGAAFGVPREFFENLNAKIEKNPRYADPEVIVIEIGGKTAERVGWGWTPQFSPNGRQIVFTQQKKPISRFRVLAETQAGNEIHLYDRDTQKTKTLAVPAEGYLTEPEFEPDGRRIVYFNGNATNGAWGGTVGVGRVGVEGGNVEPLYPVTKDFGLFHLVHSKLFVGGKWFAIRSKPTSGGFYLADSYQDELLELGASPKPVYEWKTDDGELRVAAAVAGEVLIFDRSWFPLGAEPPKKKTQGGEEEEEVHADLPAPDGKKALRESSEAPGELLLCNPKTGEVLRKLAFDGELREFAWSADSRRLAVVVSMYNPDRDEVIVLEP